MPRTSNANKNGNQRNADGKRKTKKWTLMFYFASDNPLAPSVVSQLKSLKNAGHHPDANVVAQFDPHAEQVQSHVFDVNLIEKLKNPDGNIGFLGNDPFVRNLVEDKLWSKKDKFWNDGRTIREEIRTALRHIRFSTNGHRPFKTGISYDPPMPGEEMSRDIRPARSLNDFLNFCFKEYPAKNYMLIILGHGVIVGNDMFLFDEHANRHSIKLHELGEILTNFRRKVKARKSELQLIGFHSCSMSSLEVAYELKDAARYLLASQGPAFVGSWPYRQILVRIFNDLKRAKEKGTDVNDENIRECLTKIFYMCLYNSYDFQLAGYSFDLALCDLSNVPRIEAPLESLAKVLRRGLRNDLAQELILLAHWDAQSFWRETYTDLYDFCFCLYKRISDAAPASRATRALLDEMKTACKAMIDLLKQRDSKRSKDGSIPPPTNIIVKSEFAGPAYQYSHGLSVFFPWSQPLNRAFWRDEYFQADTRKISNKRKSHREQYEFSKLSWDDFLNDYFKLTRRRSFNEEQDAFKELLPVGRRKKRPGIDDRLLDKITCLTFNESGQLGKGSGGDETGIGKGSGGDETGKGSGSDESGKGSGSDPTGDDCGCVSIKNYPSFTLQRRKLAKSKKRKKQHEPIALSPTFCEEFQI